MPHRPPPYRHPPGQVIQIHPAAPPKPPEGAPCNGCGICCLAEPCPVGMIISRRRTGACKALVWQDDEHRYRCGLLLAGEPAQGGVADTTTHRAKVHTPRQIAARGLLVTLWKWWVRRIISAGSGCDASIDVIRDDP